MSYSNFLEQRILDLAFGGVSFTPSGVLYLALSSGNPGEIGAAMVEPNSGTGYARVGITNTKANWSTYNNTVSSGVIYNLNYLEFPRATGFIGWIDYGVLFDQPVGGLMYGYGSLSTPRTIYAGDTPNFPSGTIQITLD